MRRHEYIEALEVEIRKIQAFQRELPLCFELVTQAIHARRQRYHGPSESCSNQRPTLAEFIPIKRNLSSDYDEEHSQNCEDNKNIEELQKSDWLKSVQLWNQTPDSPIQEEVQRNGGNGVFNPFKREKHVGISPRSTATAPNSTTETSGSDGGGDGGGDREEREGQSHKKSRRYWSPELHRLFLHALQHLGGSHVATPKQIREFMKVDGLTSDEVKSHLEKYRLHTRRPNPSIQTNNNPKYSSFWWSEEYGFRHQTMLSPRQLRLQQTSMWCEQS